MDKFILLGSFVIVTLILISCQSTGAEEATPDLEEILPNSTWYSAVPDSNDIYTKLTFGDLNSDIAFSTHNFPCGNSPKNTLDGEYNIFERDKLRYEFIYLIPSTTEHRAINHLEGELVLKQIGSDFKTTLKSDCNDI